MHRNVSRICVKATLESSISAIYLQEGIGENL